MDCGASASKLKRNLKADATVTACGDGGFLGEIGIGYM